jgi:glutamine synthetase
LKSFARELHTLFRIFVDQDGLLATHAFPAFGKNIDKHMSVYGAHNEERLTGIHETQSIDQFSYGVSDRGASIRVPASVPTDGWKGRLEDRRPASNGDPYKIGAVIMSTTKSVC